MVQSFSQDDYCNVNSRLKVQTSPKHFLLCTASNKSLKMPQRQKQFDKNLKHNINKNYTAQQEYTRLADCLVSSITKKQRIKPEIKSFGQKIPVQKLFKINCSPNHLLPLCTVGRLKTHMKQL